MGSLRGGHARLLLYTRVLAVQEVLGLLLAVSEVGEVPVRHSRRQRSIHPLLVFPYKDVSSVELFSC